MLGSSSLYTHQIELLAFTRGAENVSTKNVGRIRYKFWEVTDVKRN